MFSRFEISRGTNVQADLKNFSEILESYLLAILTFKYNTLILRKSGIMLHLKKDLYQIKNQQKDLPALYFKNKIL